MKAFLKQDILVLYWIPIQISKGQIMGQIKTFHRKDLAKNNLFFLILRIWVQSNSIGKYILSNVVQENFTV